MHDALPVISIIDPLGKHGGHHYYVDGTARGLTAAGHRVHVYLTAFTGVTAGRVYEERVAFGELFGTDPKVVRALRYFAGLVKSLWWARLAGTRVVNLHAFHHDMRELTAIWGCRFLGMRVALTVHDIESFGSSRSSRIRKLALAGANLLVFQNNFSREMFERLSGTAGQRSAVIAHGHYCDAYPDPPSREDARRRLGIDAEDFIFLFFGNPREEKGLDLLVRALAPLRGQFGWRLLIAGKMKPAQEAAVRELVMEAGLEDHVRIDARHIPDDETPAYYRAADIVVIPYRRIYESGVTIMSMSMARAALVSDLEPLTEKIVPAQTGLVFHCGDEADLSAMLSEALDRRDELDGFGKEGQRHVMATRNWMRIGQSLSAVICDICH